MLRWIDLPPIWMAGFAALAWAQSKLLPLPVFGPWADPLGWVLVALGVAIGGAAVVQFLLQRTTVIPRRAPNELVTGGIYRLSRNPIYLGDLLFLTGLVLIWDAALGVVLVPLFITVIQKRFIEGEERAIAQQFGEAYQSYSRKVRRWL